MMSAKGNSTNRTCARYLRSTEAFLRAQISLLRPQGKDAEVGIAIRRLKSCIKVLKGTDVDEPAQCGCNADHVSDGDFPYLIGIVAQAAMKDLFERGVLTDEDVRYLRSDKAQRDFVCRKVEFIRPYLKGDKSERLDKSGRDRYYFPTPILEWHGNKYYLTKELTKAKLPNLLHWIYAHGLNREQLAEVCEKLVGKRTCRHMAEDAPTCPREAASAPQRAIKPGKYVSNFFHWISDAGVKIPAEFIENGLSLRWSVRNLDLWRPLFATEETLTKTDRDGHRFWGKPFNFGGERLYINSQWYGKERGAKQKAGFDKMAIKIAKACGLQFLPYPLPGIPQVDVEAQAHSSISEHKTPSLRSVEQEHGGVTICVTSTRKRSFRFKG